MTNETQRTSAGRLHLKCLFDQLTLCTALGYVMVTFQCDPLSPDIEINQLVSFCLRSLHLPPPVFHNLRSGLIFVSL